MRVTKLQATVRRVLPSEPWLACSGENAPTGREHWGQGETGLITSGSALAPTPKSFTPGTDAAMPGTRNPSWGGLLTSNMGGRVAQSGFISASNEPVGQGRLPSVYTDVAPFCMSLSLCCWPPTLEP